MNPSPDDSSPHDPVPRGFLPPRGVGPAADPPEERSSAPPPPRPGGAEASLLTPPGRGALAVVGLRGPAATAIVARLFVPRGKPVEGWDSGRIGVGAWRGRERGGVAAEEVVAVRTAWGWEIHGHGGSAAPAAILDDLRRAGSALLDPGDWTTDGVSPSVAAEAAALFPQLRGPRAARILARQASGLLESAFADLRRFAAAGDQAAAAALAARLQAASRVGLRLARPWRVVVVGAVNAGKSALVNALAGHARSIVSAEPGTTRDVVEAAIVLGGWEVILVDTAGAPDGTRRPIGPVERAGIDRAALAGRAADLVLRVAVPGGGGGETDAPEGLAVWSKADLGGTVADGELSTSAVTGAGIERLAAAIIRRLVPEQEGAGGLLDGPVPFLGRHLALVRGILAGAAGQ